MTDAKRGGDAYRIGGCRFVALAARGVGFD